MGVRGLTTFIARNAEQYMKPFELHDCYLVIDGDNLACNLYKDVSGCNSAFGGDYDEYYRTVINFFQLLSQCNIRPFVLLDGGYEHKKMRTVEKRLRGKISLIKHIDPTNSKPMFPLMMREVFIDALKDSGVELMRCTYEADNELATLARRLNCPVLSYDSDFYIFNVKYIPLITLTMKVLEKKEKKLGQDKILRLCQARNLRKRKQANRGQKIILEKDEENKFKVKTKAKTVKYLDCCLYRIENLIEKGKLDKEKLPIFAALLGNDYIQPRTFNKFYNQIGMKGVSKKIPKQQKRVMTILRWLRHETKDSVLEKILSRMKINERNVLLEQVNAATDGYVNEKSDAFEFFGLTEADRAEGESEYEGSDNELESESEEELGCEECQESSNSNNDSEEEQVSHNSEDVNVSDHEIIVKEDYSQPEETTDSAVKNIDVNLEEQTLIPDWLLLRIHSGDLPRFFTDLLHLKLYINNPQIENFLYSDCNEIALPILLKIFALLHYPENIEMRYLTRVVRLTNVIYKKIPVNFETKSIKDYELTPIKHFYEIFDSIKVNSSNLFSSLENFPPDLRLYLLGIIFWSNKSNHFNVLHLHAILISLIVIRTIDSKIEPIRNEKQFHKKFGKQIQKEKNLRTKLLENESAENLESKENLKLNKTKEVLSNLSIFEKINFIPKIECIFVQENLLKHFHFQENYRKRHTEFSSSILHGFSEFQSVIFQMYGLNALVNYPLEQVRMSQVYCGLFLFNIYSTLKQRIDVKHYIENFIFRDSKIMFEFYEKLIEFCKEFVPFLKSDEKNVKVDVIKKKLKKKKAGEKQNLKEDIKDSNEVNNEESEDEFNDLNNQFCSLLNIR